MSRVADEAPTREDATAATSGGLSMALTALALGYTLQTYPGVVTHRTAIAFAATMAIAGLAVLLPRLPLRRTLEERLLACVGVVAVVYGALTFVETRADVLLAPELTFRFSAGVAIAALIAITAIAWRRPLLGRAHVPILLAVFLALGIWVLRSCPVPAIDVYLFHDEALKALLGGRSPYSITIPNIYGPAAGRFYAPGLVVQDRVLVGHPYPPLSLLLALPGYLAGDYRYALVASVVLAAAFLVTAAPGRQGRVAAALLLFTPRLFFVSVQGWSEPFVVLTLAALAYCAVRARRALPLALGAFLATKQYSVLALPAVVLLFTQPIPWRQVFRLTALALLVAILLTLPFAIRDPHGFARSVLLFQVLQPFRPESLSLLVMIPAIRLALPDFAPGIIAAAVALLLCLWRAPRTPEGFAGSVALIYLAFFAFAKQAFWNYYFLVLGGLACAVAVRDAAASAERRRSGSRKTTPPD